MVQKNLLRREFHKQSNNTVFLKQRKLTTPGRVHYRKEPKDQKVQYYCYIIAICYILDWLFALIFKLNNTLLLFVVLASYFLLSKRGAV